ncbi:related to nucleolar complex protein 2 [Ramularia collo-cygni]|uniref:Related to nucleolar complex protein 2 n=1 Tax=Ramularia collo-cygni TaxID=112498 RepID=A0A2D3V225_9PEZI|nr:related to nucleolar complex protein 2 [Ramularia collo-cygni]CZT17576.1 related to nucleolar complex protein 2 [Ramularia collo-cygni]
MVQKKAQKKFEREHLKDVLERRKGQKKTKQQQQLKAKKKARRAEEEGKDGKTDADAGSAQSGRKEASASAFKDMSVDDFFQGGFDVPELPAEKASKRKRTPAKAEVEEDDEELSSASEDSMDREAVPRGSDSGSDSEDGEDFNEQLQALAKRDPEFHKVLQKEEPDMFDDLDDLQISGDEEGEDEPKRKKQRHEGSDDEMGGSGKIELDMATVKKWRTGMVEQQSLRAAKEVVIAFRSAAQVSSADAEDKDFKYAVSNPDVYHALLTTALKHIPDIFEHHLPVQENKNGKAHVGTESKKFKTLTPILRSQISGILHLLDHLSDPATLRLTLTSTLPLLPYLLSFKKLVRDLAKAVTNVWASSSNTESTRIAAFLVMRRLVVIGDASIRENAFKAIYQALVKSSRNTTIHTMPGVNLMKNSAAELWGLVGGDGGVAYTTAFTFIRSLAIHLRGSITNNSGESYKTVYNWQYVHSLDFWSRVLAAHCTEPTSPLRPLIYPLVQVTLGALRLIPTATYFPLRFQLIRSLLRVSMATGTYIPLAAPLYEVFNSAEMRRAPKPGTLKPLDFSIAIRAPKSYLRTRIYQDGVAEQAQELLSEFFLLWTKNIAFPELALPVTVMLKRWLKEVNQRGASKGGNKNQKINTMMQLLVQKLEANARWIEEKRAKVDFAPNDRRNVDKFLADVSWEKSPLGAYVVGQRKTREEKARLVEESRKEEERRRQKDKDAKTGGDEDDVSESEEEEGDEAADDDEESEEDEIMLDGDDSE